MALNEIHAVIMVGGKCCILNEIIDPVFNRPDINLSSVTDFTNRYANQKVDNFERTGSKKIGIAKAWLESPLRRQYEGIIFDPATEGHKKGESAEYYNLYRGFDVKPKKGDWSLFKNHIREVIANGNDEVYNYIISWMADFVQNVGGKRAGVAIALGGKQGTGKGCFVSEFGKLFGSHFLQVNNQNQITGHFNSHLKDALLVFCDEGFWAGDKSAEGVIKGMITEDNIMVEPKGKDAYPVKNHIRLIIATNNKWVVPAGLEERRFCVLDVSDKHMQDRKYFGPICDKASFFL